MNLNEKQEGPNTVLMSTKEAFMNSNYSILTVKDPYSIKQSCVEDCSIVCGIINCINYEMRFNVPILTGNIYPQV